MIRQYMNGILAALALLGAAMLYRKGRTDEQAKADVEDFNEYVSTRKRIDAIDGFDDADAVRDWLRDRAKRPSNL